jgi:uncharacterized membrane protein
VDRGVARRVFVVACFAGVFHLPRIFVNLADVEDVATCDHAWCALLYAKFASSRNAHSPAWFRWFNEAPVLLLAGIVALAVVKPF